MLIYSKVSSCFVHYKLMGGVRSVYVDAYIAELLASVKSFEFGSKSINVGFASEHDKYLLVNLGDLALCVQDEAGEDDIFIAPLYQLCETRVSEFTKNFALLYYPPGYTGRWVIVRVMILVTINVFAGISQPLRKKQYILEIV